VQPNKIDELRWDAQAHSIVSSQPGFGKNWEEEGRTWERGRTSSERGRILIRFEFGVPMSHPSLSLQFLVHIVYLCHSGPLSSELGRMERLGLDEADVPACSGTVMGSSGSGALTSMTMPAS
jgi:hypothetical protein